MSDTRLRELERAWQAGDLDAEVALLRERVRLGDLPEQKLQLAATLCYEPAIDALGKDPALVYQVRAGPAALIPVPLLNRSYFLSLTSSPNDRMKAVAHLFGREASVRAAVAIARVKVPQEERKQCSHENYLSGCACKIDTQARSLLRELERWLATKFSAEPFKLNLTPEVLAKAAAYGALPHWLMMVVEGFRSMSSNSCALDDVWGLSYFPGFRITKADQRTIRDEVAPWALGYRDPVTERVRERERTGL